MVQVGVEGNQLVVHLSGWAQVWALTRRFPVPVAAVRSVAARPRPGRELLGLRLPGSFVPGLVTAGRYRGTGGRWRFWAVYRADTVLVVELEGHRYSHIVVQVDDPEGTASRLRDELGLS